MYIHSSELAQRTYKAETEGRSQNAHEGHVDVYVDDPKSLNVTRAKLAPEKDDTAPKADMSKKPDATKDRPWA
ncbi:hypothetical protein E4U50_002306 [Claviceps purpurea]|nr:hypothetical protein E4U50_002306 [Claviceps purpurea]